MTFWAGISSSADGCVVASGVVFSPATVPGTSGGGGSAALFGGGAGFERVGGVSSDARMREIGGKTARFGFASPSAVFLLGFFRSISETLSASRVEGRALSGADFESGGVPGLSTGATSSFIFCFGTAALRAAADPRAAGLRAAVLLLVFVAIVVRLKFCSWPELP